MIKILKMPLTRIYVWGPEPSFPDFERKVVKSNPPVELHVGRVPTALTKTGLMNIFSKFGDILKIDLIRGKGVGGFNFAFVTFCSRICAAEAVAMVNRAPPLHLIVTYKISDKQKAERFQQEQMVENFYQKWNGQPCPGSEELDYDEQVRQEGEGKKNEEEVDYDEEIKREERMQEEVDKFFDDSDSDVELNMLHSQTNSSKKHLKEDKFALEVEKMALKLGKVMMKCKRCGKEGVSRCSLCKVERYCSETCQGLDWPQHKKVCGAGRKIKGRDDEVVKEEDRIEIKQESNNNVQSEHDDKVEINCQNVVSQVEKAQSDAEGGKCGEAEEEFHSVAECVDGDSLKYVSDSVPIIGSVVLKVGKIMEVVVVNVESPTAIYMCPDLQELKKFQRHLFQTCSELVHDPEFVPDVGSIVLARTKSDEYWYRARVLACDQGRVTFFCPDFGFTDKVKLNRIRRINSRLAQTFLGRKFLSCRCVLKEWRDGTDSATVKETKALKRLVKISDKLVKVLVVEKRAGYYVVDLTGVDRKTINMVGDMEEKLDSVRTKQYVE